ncbi:CAP domain-containing protein [Nocardiopsis listeri]|uniref:CAP domain-containing protein n=1 Tax=Nocardiopsis listeri TaxID=53440 RepID=UPI000AAD81BD|nr:CAP domain-containing protein [Nocardiopsis listeri]
MSAREQRSLRDHPSSEYDDRYDDEYDDDFDAKGPGSARRGKRRLVPLVAGVIAVPVGLTLAGALVLGTVGEDGSDEADGASAVGEIGEGAVADDSQVPENAQDDDFFDEPTARPERAEPSGDSGTLRAQATATFSPEDGEETGAEGGDGGGGGNGDDGGDGGAGGDGTTSNAGGPLATEVVNLVNSERSANGCEPVHVDDRLTAAAQEHSDDMAARDYMAHENPDGVGPGERASRHGYDSWGAENVAKGQQSAEQVMDAWMNSEGHRRNILNCDLQAIGVGEADRAWTQKFGYE